MTGSVQDNLSAKLQMTEALRRIAPKKFHVLMKSITNVHFTVLYFFVNFLAVNKIAISSQTLIFQTACKGLMYIHHRWAS